MNPLSNNPALRKTVYTAFWLVGLALGATQVAFASTSAGQPDWLTVALAVYAFLGTGVGYTASANTSTD